MSDWQEAVRCRKHAEILRTIADEIENDEHRKRLRQIAENFENMAASLGQPAKVESSD
jgi:DnaJ-domain-containing protein 1